VLNDVDVELGLKAHAYSVAASWQWLLTRASKAQCLICRSKEETGSQALEFITIFCC
jgi:hypothetical protein